MKYRVGLSGQDRWGARVYRLVTVAATSEEHARILAWVDACNAGLKYVVILDLKESASENNL